MADLRKIHAYMTSGRRVVLDDGTTGRISRLDTTFPDCRTIALLWAEGDDGPVKCKVDVQRIVGLPEPQAAA